MKDLIYYYDKETLTKHELGEIQTGFNMSLVADGTKDSQKVIVGSFSGSEITPNTIIYHRATNTWWIVSHDKVERYEYENTPYYRHNLQLEGAIELLNARDFTDSGFNSNRYSVGDFIKRLFALSNFEFNKTSWNESTSANRNLTIQTNSNIDLEKNVDYVKTFENYTLLSAIREFLDGYNCCAKLYFNETSNVLVGATLSILSKTGNVNVQAVDGDTIFKDPRETKNMDKASFGTSVISNAENVISTKTKTYPSAGGVKLSSKQNTIDGTNAILRLPSNIFKVNYIDLYKQNVSFGYIFQGSDNVVGTFDSSNISSCQNAYDTLVDYLESHFAQVDLSELTLDFFTNFVIRIPYCDNYNAVNDDFITNVQTSLVNDHNGLTTVNKKFVVCPTITKETLTYPKTAIGYTRGNDYIGIFDCFSYQSDKELRIGSVPFSTILQTTAETGGGVSGALYIFVGEYKDAQAIPSADTQHILISDASVSVNYVPMTDMKIKLDNEGISHDSNLYNQNGRLNDSNALSKMLLSYAKEIESDSITKYGTFYGKYDTTNGFKSNLPNVGDLVNINNEYYVINNISLDFSPNENTTPSNSIGYYITAEVSLSKRVAVKSLLTSPNTNIRDYGIPQNNNVKRKQVYRDFYEFTYEKESDSHNWYMPLGKVLDLTNVPNQYKEHIGVIQAVSYEEINGSKYYYYQLETTTYQLKKSIYEILDFKDNNIIGYGGQNKWSGFDIKKIFVNNNTYFNTPISYVDDNGELAEINIKFATIDNLQNVYEDYKANLQEPDKTTYANISIYNASVFIPSDIYLGLGVNGAGNYDFEINELNYRKDALEVPVFEYSCQVDDTTDILVGENIFDSDENNVAYLYQFALVNDITQFTDNNFTLNNFEELDIDNSGVVSYTNVAKFDTTHINDNEPYIVVKLYEDDEYDVNDNSSTLGSNYDFPQSLSGKQLIVVRNTLTQENMLNIVGELFSTNIFSTQPQTGASLRNKCYVDNTGNYYVCEADSYSLTFTTDSNVQSVVINVVDSGVIKQYDLGDSDSLTITIHTGDNISWVATPKQGYSIVGSNMADGKKTESWTQGDDTPTTRAITSFTYGFYVSCDSNTTAHILYHSTITNQDYDINVATSQSVNVACGVGGSYNISVAPINANYELDDTQESYVNNNVISQPSDIYCKSKITYVSLTVNMSGSYPFTMSGSTVDKIGTITEISYAYQGISHTETYQIVKGGSYDITFAYDTNSYYTESVAHRYNNDMQTNDNVSFSVKPYCFIYITFNTGVASISFTSGGTTTVYQASGGNKTIKLKQGIAYSWTSTLTNSYQYEFASGQTGSGTTSGSSAYISPTTSVKEYKLRGTSTNGVVKWFTTGTPQQEIGLNDTIPYGDSVAYLIVANEGYVRPSDYSGTLTLNESVFSMSLVSDTASKTFSPCTIQKFDMTWNFDTGVQGVAYNHNNSGYVNLNRGGRTSITLNLAYGTIVWYAYPDTDYIIPYPITPIQSFPETITFNQDTTRNATATIKKPTLTLSGSIGGNRPRVNVANDTLSQSITITSVIYAPSGVGQSTTLFSGSQVIASGNNADFTGRLFDYTIQTGDSIYVYYTYKGNNYSVSKDY